MSRLAVHPLTGRPSGKDMLAFLFLQCAALALLLIASVNAAGLLLTRAVERGQEIAVRATLGAGRGRVVRQLFVESSLLALASGILGLVVAHPSIEGGRLALPATVSGAVLGWERVGVDGSVVAFAFALTVVTAVAIGVVPARCAVRGSLAGRLREAGPTVTGGRWESRIARLLLSGDVALASALLLTALLLVRSLVGLLAADPGFEAAGVLTAQWALPPKRYDRDDAVVRFQDPLLERLRALPGVVSAGFVSNLPMSRTGWTRPFRVEGGDPDAEPVLASWRPISTEYLQTLGIPLLEGRHFTRSDGSGAPKVVIVSASLAGRTGPGVDPLGRRLEVGDASWTVIGVVDDVHDFGVERRAALTIYVPQSQSPTTTGFLAVRTTGDPDEYAARVRQEIWGLDPDVAIVEVRTLPRVVRDFYAQDRLLV